MIKHNVNGVIFYTFEHFDKTGLVKHCFTTKKGGVSDGVYESMSLGVRDGDDMENVIENYRRLCGAVGFDVDKIVLSDQVHKTELRCVDERDFGKGLFKDSDIRGIDGLLTDKAGAVLTTFYADCVPLFFLDPVKKVVALSHAGWRGTLMEIGAKTVEKMGSDYGSSPKNILAGIGPSIGKCCFEVGAEVADEFASGLDFSKQFIYKSEKVAGKFYIDLWAINRRTLTNAGLPDENIETAGICTKCNHDIFYSHRQVGKNRGSMAAMMSLCRSDTGNGKR